MSPCYRGDFGTRLASLASGTVDGTLLLPHYLRAQELGLRPLYELFGQQVIPRFDHDPAILYTVAARNG
jgi:hypothetical protein